MLLINLSCSESEKACLEVKYGETFQMEISDEVCFPDENVLKLDLVEHEFCPCGVVCIWEGDLLVTLTETSDGNSKVKSFYPTRIEIEPEIFNNHRITSVSYTYDDMGANVPPCAEDFDQNKLTIELTIEEF